MKKLLYFNLLLIVILLFIIFIIASFCSCNNDVGDANENNKLNCYESSVIDMATDGIIKETEVDFWTGVYYRKENMPSNHCFVQGKKYYGEYKWSIDEKLNSYTTDIYTQNGIDFGLRADNGNLNYINFMNSYFFETEPFLENVKNPQENARALAKEVAMCYLDSVDEYTQINEEPITRYYEKNNIKYELTYYTTTFARKIKGFFSSDYIAIRVTSKGNIASISMGDIGAFEGASIKIDDSVLQESITSKVNLIYKESDFQINTFTIVDQKITITPHGNVCIYSEINVFGKDEANAEKKTGIRILTALEE